MQQAREKKWFAIGDGGPHHSPADLLVVKDSQSTAESISVEKCVLFFFF